MDVDVDVDVGRARCVGVTRGEVTSEADTHARNQGKARRAPVALVPLLGPLHTLANRLEDGISGYHGPMTVGAGW